MYTLFAYGGDLTAGRRKAAYVYGDWSVSLPDGVDTEPQDNRVGRGYVARVNDKPRGRFDQTFVQEGASVDMQSKTTDLEVVLDDAFTQTDGDVFFEHDIAGVGLNGTMPERDYTTGDLVRVVRWGKAMALPVTGTALKTDKDGRIAGSTHVGGELISSKRATQKLSDELRRSISKEMAETVRTGTKALRTDVGTLRTDVTRVSGVASSAQTAATNAQSTADSAKTTASSAYTRSGTAIERAGNAETVAGEARRKADSALQTVDLATGNMGQYLDQVAEMVDDARAEVTKAETARTGAESALSSAEQISTNMSQWATDIGKEVSKAKGLVSDVSQASADLDPKIRNVTNLLSQATTANTNAIRLNTEADQLRDRAIIDLTDAGKKLSQSQQNLQAATSLNTASIENLEKSQREHAAATKELGTAQQALATAVQNNAKVVTAVQNSQTALETAQKADRRAAAEAIATQRKVNEELRSFDRYLTDYTAYGYASRPVGFFVEAGQTTVVGNNSSNFTTAVRISAPERYRGNYPYVEFTNTGRRTVRVAFYCQIVAETFNGTGHDVSIRGTVNENLIITPGETVRATGSAIGNVSNGQGHIYLYGDYEPKLYNYIT